MRVASALDGNGARAGGKSEEQGLSNGEVVGSRTATKDAGLELGVPAGRKKKKRRLRLSSPPLLLSGRKGGKGLTAA